jgi:hypothetical protein
MIRTRPLLALAIAAFATALDAATPPPPARPLDDRKMSTIYVLAHAGAILDLCLASPEAPTFPEAKSREIQDLAGRLDKLVRTVGTHYRDAELSSVYAATKAQMATDTKLRFHVKSNHQYCGELTLGEMRAYVADNEALIGNYLAGKRAAAPPPKK